jgi:hypothetical protein
MAAGRGASRFGEVATEVRAYLVILVAAVGIACGQAVTPTAPSPAIVELLSGGYATLCFDSAVSGNRRVNAAPALP